MSRLIVKSRIKNYGIDCLYYMLPIENVPHVMKKGILSYKKVKSIAHKNFADISVQNLRDNLYISDTNKYVHDYVPLYFTTHTPMQYVLTQKNGVIDQRDLVFIEVDAVKVFSTPGVIFSDGNLACNETNLYIDLDDLCKLDWFIIHKVPNCYSPEYKRKKSAEVLVPDRVPVRFFLRVVVIDAGVKRKLKEIVKCCCEVDRAHYYKD